ncbi:MAG: hypothetical protein QOK29_221 [Rhodospirillaceae bacterium]|nr:hypothetical protein [Rhodospirillaceae bacterium]
MRTFILATLVATGFATAALAETSWPANVPSLKPGTTLAASQPKQSAWASSATAGKATAGKTAAQTQTASLPPAPANAAALKPTKVTLQASVMAGAKPLRDTIVWTVSQSTADNRPGTVVATQTAPKAEFSLTPGSYIVTIKDAEAIVNQPLLVGSTPMSKVIPLNVSVVGMKMITSTGAKPIKEPIHWEVFAAALGKPGPDSKIADAVSPTVMFHLTQGYYVVRSHYKDVTSDLVMHVEPGVTYSYTVDLYAANLSARAVNASGKAPKGDVTWRVVRSVAEQNGERRLVASNTGAQPDFLVREGQYVVIATAADGTTGQTPIDIRAGKPHRVTVVLKPAAKTGATTTN